MWAPRPIGSVACGVLSATLAVVLWYPSHTDFSTSNPFWNGLTDAAAQWRMAAAPALDRVPAQVKSGGTIQGTVLVMVPVRPFAARDIRAVRRYLDVGGVVVLLDDRGFGNQVLAGLGLPVRLAGPPLLDPLFNQGVAWLPTVPRVSILPPGGTIALDRGTALTGAGMTPIADSSPFAFLDRRRTGRADPGDPSGPFFVAAWAGMGAGRLFIIADPSVLMNGMIGLAGNREFLGQVFAGRAVFLDTRHLPAGPLDHARAALHSLAALAGSGPVLLGLLLAGVGGPLVPVLRRWGRMSDVIR